jgi:hypothetical protein
MNGAIADGDSFYDGEFYYDAPIGPKKGHMARIVKNTSKLNATQLAGKLQVSLTAVAATPATFTGATAVLATGATKRTALLTADALIDSLKGQLTLARESRDQAIFDADEYYEKELMSYVWGIAKGSASIILLAGMDVAQPQTPPPTMTKVLNVTLTAGESDQTAFADWKSEGGAYYYDVQVSANPNDAASWVNYDHPMGITSVGLTLVGLPSGQKRWVRVRAVNPTNKGPWSDPACCMVP